MALCPVDLSGNSKVFNRAQQFVPQQVSAHGSLLVSSDECGSYGPDRRVDDRTWAIFLIAAIVSGRLPQLSMFLGVSLARFQLSIADTRCSVLINQGSWMRPGNKGNAPGHVPGNFRAVGISAPLNVDNGLLGDSKKRGEFLLG